MNAKGLILRHFRAQTLNKALTSRNLTTQSLNPVKRLYLLETRCLLPAPQMFEQSVRNSQSFLPKRKRGYVWAGRKEDTDYERSGLLLRYYWCFALTMILTFYYWKKGLFY